MTSSFLTVILLTVLLVLPTCFVEAAKGLDVSAILYDFDFKDFVEGGSGDFAILQGYRSNGSVNHNALVDNDEAHVAGYTNFDVYMSPCPRCNKSASQQVQEMVKALKNMTTTYGHIWLEVNETKSWHLSQKTNRNFFKELISETIKHKPTGVYTSEVGWRKIMGKSTIGSAYPLWYVRNDTNPSDFKPFGGWTKPHIKQYYQIYKGIDVSGPLVNYDFKDFMEAGIDGFVIFQGYQSDATVNPNAINDSIGAYEAGFDNFDMTLSPCPRCNKTAAQQVQEMVKALHNVSYGHIWLDVTESEEWLGSNNSNQKYFEDLVSETSKHKPAGVYTTQSQWESIMGMNYTGGMSLPLWYVDHDQNPSFDGFGKFGGWSKPSLKQYGQELDKRGYLDYNGDNR